MRVDTSVPRARRRSWTDVSRASAERVSAGRGVEAAAVAVEAGVEETTGAGVTGAATGTSTTDFAAVFLGAGVFGVEGIVFTIEDDLDEGIFNAVVILYTILTCLNHNL